MITHILGIRCDRCSHTSTYLDTQDVVQVMYFAKRYGWEWSDNDHSLCPMCVSQIPSAQDWRPSHEHTV